MAKLKLGPINDEKPVRVTAELPAAVHRDLLAYAEVFVRETGQSVEAAQLVGPVLARFMATDRAFAKARRTVAYKGQGGGCCSARSAAWRRAALRKRLKAGLSFCADHTMLTGIAS